MKLRQALELVGGEDAIDSLCAPATSSTPMPVGDLERSLREIRAEQPRLIVRLMDSPLAPSAIPNTAADGRSEVILRDAGQVARRFIQSLARTGGELLDVAGLPHLAHDDRLLAETLALISMTANLASRRERQPFASQFRAIIAEVRAVQADPVGIALTPMLRGGKDDRARINRLADALIRIRQEDDELSSGGEQRRPITRSDDFDLWVRRLIGAGTRRLATLGAPTG